MAAHRNNNTHEVKARREQLRMELITELSDLRRALQKWHAAVRRVSGDAASDILRGQGRVLALLNTRGEMLQRDMCVELDIRPQSLGETLMKLERSGYIERKASEHDRRTQTVRITEAGRRCVTRNRPQIPFEDFTEEEAERFLSYLRRAMVDINKQSAHLATLAPQGRRN